MAGFDASKLPVVINNVDDDDDNSQIFSIP